MGESKDFAALYQRGDRRGSTYAIGATVARWRDQVARACIWCGATPNRLTVAGFLSTVGCGLCLLFGASYRAPWEAYPGAPTASSWWPVGAFVFLFVACAFDMLDGAVARIGRMASPFGGVLDSTLDRFSDGAIYLGCATHFAMVGNVTYVALAIVAMCNTYMISYVKARAEDLIDDCSVGWWLRGERCVGLLIGMFFCHIPGLLWQQATLPALTVWRRISYTRAELRAKTTGGPPAKRGPLAGVWRYLAPWRFPRGSVPYDLVAWFNIGYIIVMPWIHPFFYGGSDPLRGILEHVLG
jgi:CDP-diacylglycerol--glycerol-3-phosphate 3-phosphatidyltransferase